MRLLHTTTLELKSFISPLSDAPPYAILSHTWEADEVLFEDMATPESRRAATVKKGWDKVHKSCEVARDKRYEYIWIDTLCIDKSSSAELSEAINSMFAWYAYSGYCIAFMADIVHNRLPGDTASKAFRDSRWFTRAWTLQELIAPAYLVFYDAEWCWIGDRRALSDVISARASIYPSTLAREILPPVQNLEELKKNLRTVCIAVKMNWAAQRQATRDEDMAYSLLGVFDVNMPMLYGEGRHKAFLRLQEEIIKHGFDHTLLSWRAPSANLVPRTGRWDWVLAPVPDLFAESRNLTHLRGQHRMDAGTLYPDGLKLDGVMVCPVQTIQPADTLNTAVFDVAGTFLLEHEGSIELTSEGGMCTYLAVLRCCSRGNYSKRIGILVFKDRSQPDRYYRAHESLFVVGVGDEYLTLGDRTRLRIDFGKAESQQIMLCIPPTLSWQKTSGSWPCGYNWTATDPGWRFKEYIECRMTNRGVIEPELPSWSPDGLDLHMSNTVSPSRYKVNGILLFEKVGASAFLVLWGSVPEFSGRASGVKSGQEDSAGEGSQSQPPWWKSKSGYFCCVVDWEKFVEGPYRSTDLNRAWRDRDLRGSPFYGYLLRWCLQTVMVQSSLKGCAVANIGKQTRVEASVGNHHFLGVDGVVVKVTIARRARPGSSAPPDELHTRLVS